MSDTPIATGDYEPLTLANTAPALIEALTELGGNYGPSGVVRTARMMWPATADNAADLLEYAWTIICNAGEGDWTRESAEWQGAAARLREQYHAFLDTLFAPVGPTT